MWRTDGEDHNAMRSHHLSTLALICAAGLCAPALALAETTPATATTSTDSQLIKYTPDYFAQFQAASALDMVFHVPGFSFNRGDNSVRGFAGAAGNVLIDGQRPANKDGLDQTLDNISIAQVDHIELITGNAPGIDMQGYRQIVNVVRKTDAKATIQYGGNVKVYPDESDPATFLTYSSNKNGSSLDVHLELFRFRDNGVWPTKRWVYTPGVISPQFIDIPQKGGGWGHQEKIDYSRPFLGGKLSFNGNYNPIDYDLNAAYISNGNTAPEHMDIKQMPSDLGLQFERSLNKKLTLDLNALRRYERDMTDDVINDTGVRSEYKSLSQSSEQIFSAKLTYVQNDKMTYKFGGETALNVSDNTTSYTQNNTSQNVPSDIVRVEEDRKEYYVTGNWQPLKKLSVEAAMKVETSTISVKQANRSKSFVYPKPEIQIVWSPTDKIKWSWRTERVIGQLNFGDFASSVSLDTSVVKAGNPDIVPQKEWQNSLSFDYSFWDKGAFNLTFKHAALEDTLDYAPIVTSSGVFNARANIGDGTRDDISTTLTLPTDKLHIKGGQLKIDYTRTLTRVTDPITHKSRAISNFNPETYIVTFDQNFPKSRTSWGMEIDSLNNSQQFNASDGYRFVSQNWFALYGEYKTKNNLTFGVVLQNPWGRRDKYDRTVWTGQRDLSPIDHIEHNKSLQKPFIIFRVRKEM